MREEDARGVRLLRQMVRRDPIRDGIWEAAIILNTIEAGKKLGVALAEGRAARLRKTKLGRSVDPTGALSTRHFAERFLQKYAPDWNWRAQRETGRYERQNERIARMHAELARHDKALRTRFVTPDEPDAEWLSKLQKIRPEQPSSWATLRVLKFATGMPERAIWRMIMRAEPQEYEICVVGRRPVYQKRGGLPKRYAPRLVVVVLDEFITRATPKSVIRRKAAVVKRVLSRKIADSARTT